MPEVLGLALPIGAVAVVLFCAKPQRILARGPNVWVGVRTAETMKSEAAWAAAHRAAWPHVVAWSAGALVVMAVVFVGLASGVAQGSDWPWITVILALILWAAGLVRSARVAQRAARAVD